MYLLLSSIIWSWYHNNNNFLGKKFFFYHSDTYNAPIDVFDFSVIKTSLLASTHILPAILLMYAALQDFKKIVTVQNKNKCWVKKKE